MNKKYLLLIGLFTIFLPSIASADMMLGMSDDLKRYLLFIILIEIIIFLAVFKKITKSRIKSFLWRIILSVMLANHITYIIGIYIPSPSESIRLLHFLQIFEIMGFSFLISVLLEYLIIILFFIKSGVKTVDFLKISFIINLASYIFIFLIFVFQWQTF